MRRALWAFALLAAGCSDSSPTRPAPTPTGDPQFSMRFVLTNTGSLSLSEPASCTGDWSTCARGSQAQGAETTSAITNRSYTLTPGTYRLTGVLRPSTPTGASVDIRIGAGPSGSRGGVAREGPVIAFVAFDGPSTAVHSVNSLVCGATFSTVSNPAGALEWAVTFRVVETPVSPDQLCQ
jgi:hypothetical protein